MLTELKHAGRLTYGDLICQIFIVLLMLFLVIYFIIYSYLYNIV